MLKRIKFLGAIIILVICTSVQIFGAVASSKQLVINGDWVLPPATNGNPYISGYIGGGIEPYLQDNLFSFTAAGKDKFKPHLGQKYVIQGKDIIVTLKPNLKWSDGATITAEDIATSFYMWVGKKQIWEFLDTITIVNPTTLKFTFKTQSPLMMNLLNDVRIEAPTKVYGTWANKLKEFAKTDRVWHSETTSFWYNEAWDAHRMSIEDEVLKFKPKITESVSSGPYTVKNLTTSEVLLVKNNFFRSELPFETIKVLRLVTSDIAAAAMVDGTLDVHSGGMTPDLLNQVKKRVPDYHDFYVPEYSQMALSFNLNKWPANDINFRRAVGYLVNKPQVLPIAEVGSMPSDNSASGLPLSLQKIYGLDKWATENLEQFTYNPKKAEEILIKAGWKKVNGKWQDKTGKLVSFNLTLNSGWGSAMQPGEAISSEMKKFGFEVIFRPMEGGAYDTHLLSMEHTVGIEFVPSSNVLYAHPYGSYQALFDRGYLMGLKADKNGKIMLKDKNGKNVDVKALVSKLFTEMDKNKSLAITKQLMEVTSVNVMFVPYLEKGFPVRTLKSNINLGIKDGSLVEDSRFSGLAETMFSSLIIENSLRTTGK